jgi:sugar phosphate isomerase/epimerase
MKRLFLCFLLSASTAWAGDFSGKAGLQLYSLRDSFKKDVPGSLDKVKALGFTEVETASTYGMPPDKFVAMLKERGLQPISGHFQYDALSKDLAGAVRDAKALGLKFAACPWIPHDIAEFTEATARKAAADFNAWGAAFAKEGITFTYHAHGYEFVPFGDGTLFDLLVKETKPEAVSFEMDVFWILHPGQDPVKLMEKYPNRWALMHLKDIRKGAKTGVPSGRAPLTDDVTLGTGMADWPAILRTASKVGVKHYFIEDESPTVEDQLPNSLKYLETLK